MSLLTLENPAFTTRVCQTIAYATEQNDEVRATFWTIGSVLTIAMAFRSLIAIL